MGRHSVRDGGLQLLGGLRHQNTHAGQRPHQGDVLVAVVACAVGAVIHAGVGGQQLQVRIRIAGHAHLCPRAARAEQGKVDIEGNHALHGKTRGNGHAAGLGNTALNKMVGVFLLKLCAAGCGGQIAVQDVHPGIIKHVQRLAHIVPQRYRFIFHVSIPPSASQAQPAHKVRR